MGSESRRPPVSDAPLAGLFGVRRTASPAGGHAQCLAPLEPGAETLVELRARCSQTCRALVRSAATTSEGKKGGSLWDSRPVGHCLCAMLPSTRSSAPLIHSSMPPIVSHGKIIARRRKNEHAGNLQIRCWGTRRERMAWRRRVEGRRKLPYLACPPAMPGLSDTLVPYHSALSASLRS